MSSSSADELTISFHFIRRDLVSVYTGNAHTHKIGKLSERTDFHFRICAANEAGEGPFSDICTFTTLTAPPYAPKRK